MKDDFEKLLARKMFELLRKQTPGDIAELRELAKKARERGYAEIADHADAVASAFEEEDNHEP